MEIEAADVNGDGHTDLVTNNAQSNSISVLLGNGDGTFQDQFGFFGGLQVVDLLLADFDEDGDLDLATLANQNKRVHIFENPGDGRFTNRQDFPLFEKEITRNSLYSFRVEDVFEDGRLDIVVPMNWNDPDIVVVENIGMFDFVTQFNALPHSGEQYVRYQRVDLDLDGDLDIVASVEGDEIIVYLNAGDDQFPDDEYYSTNSAGGDFHIVDLNNDGYPDLIAVPSSLGEYESNILDVFINDGTGAFTDRIELYTSEYIADASIADIDLDGDLDILTANWDANGEDSSVSMFLNNGDGTFADEIDSKVPGDVRGIALTDVNADGLLDILTTAASLDRVGVMINQGAGIVAHREVIFAEHDPRDYVRADMNADGVPDLVFALGGLNMVRVVLQNADGSVLETTNYPVSGYAVQVVAEDVDLDGDIDVVAASSSTDPDMLGVLLNQGDGTLADSVSYVVGDLDSSRDQVHTPDVNGDGYPDLIAINGFSRDLTLLLNDGLGSFVDTPITQVTSTRFTHIDDIDQDGDVDVVSINTDDRQIEVLRNDGAGLFILETQDAPDIESGFASGDFELGDVDLDGDPDLVTVSTNRSEVQVFTNSGMGMFELTGQFDTRSFPHEGLDGVLLSDLDIDGDLDALLYNEHRLMMSVLLNDGDGAFTYRSQHALGRESNSGYEFRDMNNDGYPDLTYRTKYIDGIGVIYNQCANEAECRVDLNGDGGVNFFDVAAFLAAFAAEESVADFNADGAFNFFDVAGFLELFQSGCP
jgi:hypothetical protein